MKAKKRSLAESLDDKRVETSDAAPELNELKAITMDLKVTESIVVELVPGIDNLLD